MDKWEKLRNWLNTGAFLGHDYCNDVLRKMDEMDAEEQPKEVFYYSGVPDFDKKTWEKMLSERGLQGLA